MAKGICEGFQTMKRGSRNRSLRQYLIQIPGEPQPKHRHRSTQMGRFIKQYPDPRTVSWENRIAWFAWNARANKEGNDYNSSPMLTGPIEIELYFFFIKPKSTPDYHILKTTKPDIDNLTKCVMDALEGTLYLKDSEIVKATSIKLFGAEPFTLIKIKEVTHDSPFFLTPWLNKPRGGSRNFNDPGE